MKILITLLLPLGIIGCATDVIKITYTSDPPGATFREPSGKVGYLPLHDRYDISDDFKKGGCINLDNIEAQWRSGAKASSGSVQVCGREGANFKYEFKRPSHPNLLMDQQKADANGKLQMIQIIRGCDDPRFPASVTCIKRSYASYGVSPNSREVKNFYLLADGVVEDFNNKKVGYARAKAELIKAWQSTIDASNNRNENAASRPIAPPTGGIDSYTRNQMYQDCLKMATKDYRTCIP